MLRDRATGRFRKQLPPVREIGPIESSEYTRSDILVGFLEACGASVSGTHAEAAGQKVYTDRWEFFDPEMVVDPDALPEHWRMVYDKHNEPVMGDCVMMRYRYVHAPAKIIPQYPRAECRGIFCVVSRKPSAEEVSADDLVWIGNEFVG